MKLGIIFGSSSLEHEVSIVSATSIIEYLDKEKYDIIPIYIDKFDEWYWWHTDINKVETFNLGNIPSNLEKIDNIPEFLKTLAVGFPVIHGKNGEDGRLIGLLELFNIPYVGCGVLSCSIGFDKVFTKSLVKNITNVAPDIVLKKEYNGINLYQEGIYVKKANKKEIISLVSTTLNYPIFIKPSKSGSSVGVTKVTKESDLLKAIDDALEYDNEILIEKMLEGRELECAVLKGKAIEVGEVMAAEAFYSYDAKYVNSESKTIIPAPLSKELREKILKTSEIIFKSLNCKGLARIDYFYDDVNNILYFNEINNMPGFTKISMYPKLVVSSGISYSKLLDELINDALK